MSSRSAGWNYLHLWLLAIALVLPTATLIPLGSLWLWDHGYLSYWALATCLVVAMTHFLQRRLFKDLPTVEPAVAIQTGDAGWTPLQTQAWADVVALAASASPGRLTSRDDVVNLALETIELVARRLHPERRDPLLQFTVPEALVVIERASMNLREFVMSSLPLGDRITISQIMVLYRWRGAVAVIEKGYGAWRVWRMLNPVTAATQEVRDRFAGQIYDLGREHVGRRLAQAFVKEVGRAAIDLYGMPPAAPMAIKE